MGDGKAALTVALDGRDAFVLQGAARELDKLEDQAAEKIFAQVDPTNYVIYLGAKGRGAEGLAAAARLPKLAKTPAEMSNAYSLWSSVTFSVTGDLALAAERARISVALDPKTTASHLMMMWLLMPQGHDEEALVQAREIATKREEDEPAWRNSDGVEFAKLQATDLRNATAGDFREALSEPCSRRCDTIGSDLKRAEYAARLHDLKLTRTLTASAEAEGQNDPEQQQRTGYFAAAAAGDWPAALASARAYLRVSQAIKIASGARDLQTATQVTPLLAYALARTGDVAAAHRAIDATPADCYLCLDMRGKIDALQGNWSGAQTWFARAVAASPSSVFAYADWGSMLLARGKPDAAIAKFKLANQKGPHFADPLEGWGEALMAKNQSHLALAKFAEAEQIRAQLGPAASEMGRGPRLCRQARRRQGAIRPRRRPRSHAIRKIRTGEGCLMSEETRTRRRRTASIRLAVSPGAGRRQPRQGRCLSRTTSAADTPARAAQANLASAPAPLQWLERRAFEASLAFAGAGGGGGAGLMVWGAAHANGLVIRAFSVPPDLAARGLTGEVVASKMLDEICVAQTLFNTVAQDPAVLANNWGNDIKVEIPETGISLGEVYRFLREWLGHETMVGGEIVRTPEGLAMTVVWPAATAPPMPGRRPDWAA